ncbi:MAG: acetyl-CoA carboxylase biotin carboxylase subunit [Candidatus Fonsibacter lacus]|uniref:Biotin carboxylase n=3 Tax=Candidatus Fonsibacter lacus TaxID=2576439 RepID=A0A966HPC1_9PROT|nr:acetyl-CoA carboxylase biotin carboxylase subunit [Pseudomonadota bacterium]NCU47123.1 acetyl-CoA carboxylase biotin carboxylase subunit [Candidatus Fonsibacter lacus]NCU50308.1 acetyl-CoA carboxylase biotin carboxylase subunit [Candidatus Fonsibacter lacus]NCU53113.1 acetyl-CoA carboxylase biotin carboxylase subunit [Candidatus Fonsibacter lacus]NCU70046.1 acetyl-CoA carboxylase biotin carboxylase subunit [Candidatus Fonsibacter lacus]
MIKKILIANRGEIAVRVIRACKELEIATVAVHSTADNESMHVRLADESICIGSQKAQDSYLNIPSLISAIEITGADAVHPGYGFLSENYKFAEILEQHKIKFIGPSSELIRKMGDKIEAKKIAKSLGLPIVSGSETGIKDIGEAIKISKEIGFPVLIKAAGGGGGKGMRIVHSEDKLEENIKIAQTEAKKFFNNEEVFIEKFFENPRHIEVQILSDGKENTVHLGERDCSVQRRYQKIIEESPCPVINDEQRKYLLDVSVNAISKLGYEGAGTLEFIYDKGKFYFLEMNTRLQVEHPVTEEVTGIDLVKRQIEIASTGKLSLQQKDITFFGHAIECRINAEDPSKDFLPSAGTIKTYNQPSGPGTRVDSCVFQGCKIPPYYDSLVAKLICHGRDRSSAISRLKRSLDEFVIEGVSTTIDLHKKILRNEDFINSKYDVNWLSKTKFY